MTELVGDRHPHGRRRLEGSRSKMYESKPKIL